MSASLTADPRTAVRPEPTRMGIGLRLVWLGPTGIVVAVGLSVVEWILVRSPENAGSVLAALAAVLMTAPVALARRWPVLAATAVAAAAVLNGLVFDDLVRCAGAFPAALYIAFGVGAHGRMEARDGERKWSWALLGLGITFVGLLAQYVWDPALHNGRSFLAFGPALAVVCWAGGIGWSFLRSARVSRRAVDAG